VHSQSPETPGIVTPETEIGADLLPALCPGLYIVATPIGNLGDLSPRAAAVLAGAALIAAEDTRVTAKLLAHIGVRVPMQAYHDHSDEAVRPGLIARALREAVALVSDAGTPLISDPGYRLVREARAAGVNIVTLPGPCAAIAALTLAGLPTDRFLFAGFLSAKAAARRSELAELGAIRATLVFYESGPRLAASLAAMAETLGDRPAAVAREISKRFEEAVTGNLSELAARYAAAPPRGEIVIVVGPPEAPPPADAAALDAALAGALARGSVKAAVAEVAATLGLPRQAVYARALALRDAGDGAAG
jgi:16S rRNA (cytidine1402-2'-O)-methyltransferase